MSPARRPSAGRLAPALAAGLALAGCLGAAQRGYPPDWPRRAEGRLDACPALAGRWSASAAEDPFSTDRTDLAVLLWSAEAPEVAAADEEAWVELAQPDAATLVVRRGTGDGPPGEPVTLRRGADFDCERGALRRFRAGKLENANVCTAQEHQAVGLWRAEGGALVAKKATGGLCLGLLSAAVGESAWYRFLPVGR